MKSSKVQVSKLKKVPIKPPNCLFRFKRKRTSKLKAQTLPAYNHGTLVDLINNKKEKRVRGGVGWGWDTKSPTCKRPK